MQGLDNVTGGLFPKPNFTGGKPGFELKKMNERHHQIVRYATLGYKHKQIAQKLGITAQSVGQVLSSPIVQLKRETLRGARDSKALEIMDEIEKTLPDAVKLLQNLVNGGDLMEGSEYQTADRALQKSAAKDILGIAGYSPVKRSESKHMSTTLTSDEIKEMVNHAKAQGIASGDVVEAEYKEVD